jgi:hypothetical protein
MAELTGLGHRAVTNPPAMDVDQYLAGLPGRAAHRPVVAREPVSVWAIHAWCDVMGERGSAVTGENPLAPLATPQMWTFPGLVPGRPVDAGPATPGDLDLEVRTRLAGAGLTATLATATDQEFRTDLRPGDRSPRATATRRQVPSRTPPWAVVTSRPAAPPPDDRWRGERRSRRPRRGERSRSDGGGRACRGDCARGPRGALVTT